MISPDDYEELLQRLAIDIPAAIPELVKYSGSVAQPAQGSSITWDNTQKLYVPTSGGALLTAMGIVLWRKVGTTSGPTTTSGSFVTIPEMTLTANFSGGPVICWFLGNFQSSTTPTSYLDTAILLDGGYPDGSHDWTLTAIPAGITTSGGTVVFPFARTDVFTPSAGSHTISMTWLTGGGTATTYGQRRSLMILQLPVGFPVN
jgi:hypothetical protein